MGFWLVLMSMYKGLQFISPTPTGHQSFPGDMVLATAGLWRE